MTRHQDLDDSKHVPCVPFVPFRCPHCGGLKPFTYGRVGSVRYHRCQQPFCGRSYRSLELTADAIPNWKPPDGGQAG